MVNIKIQDSIFNHVEYSTLFNKSSKMKWDRTPYSIDDIVIFTDNNLKSVNLNIKTKIAWLLESPVITKSSYEWIANNYDKFDLILTFDKDLLDLNDKFKLNPVGGCWIKPEDHLIYDKTKNISIISSDKNFTIGHKLRHDVIKNCKGLEIYGRGFNNIEYKLDGLKDYRFSVAIENTKKDYYFTEKLIDCFMTGTIPIYYGCPSINDFFDNRGIIQIDSYLDLNNIINTLNENKYNEVFEYVKINFEKAKKYLISEDNIYNTLKKLQII